MNGTARARRLQDEHWRRANRAHFRWKTEAEGFAESEPAPLDDVLRAGRCLEVGCGEGANLRHIPGGERHGVDRSRAKVAFAVRNVAGLRAVVADAEFLPYAAESFDVVLLHDLLHHVGSRERALSEAWRVLRPGGKLVVLEANVRHPLFFAQALCVPAERGLFRSTPRRLRSELRGLPGATVRVETRQPVALRRLLLHPDWGSPSLGRRPLVRCALSRLERLCARTIPRAA